VTSEKKWLILIIKKHDAVFQSRVNLAIAYVFIEEEAELTSPRDMVKITYGNLNSHLKKLKDAGYVSWKKRVISGKPLFSYKIIEKEDSALEQCVNRLEKLVRLERQFEILTSQKYNRTHSASYFHKLWKFGRKSGKKSSVS
jgi:hypothetical protein